MSDLVERYVHEVVRYLPQGDREEVQNELRSLLQDQLDDRYKGAPSDDDIVELLTEFGPPRQMAASYSGEQYLVGPDLYPTMMMVLQRGWLWVPIIVVLVRVLVAFLGSEPTTLFGLFLDTAFAVVQALFVFSAIVVLIFALLQHFGVDLAETQPEFNPLDLPAANDPAAVERGEVAFGVAFSIFGLLILTYFLRVGGLTMRFNLIEPVEVLPVPTNWLILWIVVAAGSIVIDLLALRRGRWNAAMLLSDGVLELVGVVCGYHVLMVPLFDLLYANMPALANLPFAANAPLLLSLFIGVMTAVDKVVKLGKITFAQ